MEEFWRLVTFGLSPAQRNMVFSVCWRLIVTAHIFLACGWASMTGFPGFARADDVTSLRRTQADAAAEVVASNIFDTRVRQCQAMTPEARQFYAQRLQALLERYYEITQRNYTPIPSCAELQ